MHQMGASRTMATFSTPCLSRTVTWPFSMPRARNCPSFVHEAHRILAGTLCFCTDFCSGDHRPKSDAVQEASCCVTGLYTSFWMVSLWLYFRIPCALSVQMMMVLSAPPDAKRLPSRE